MLKSIATAILSPLSFTQAVSVQENSPVEVAKTEQIEQIERKAEQGYLSPDRSFDFEIQHAILNENIQALETHLADNVNIFIQDGFHTPLHLAVIYGKEKSVLFLLSKGTKMDLKDRKGDIPLALAIKRSKTEIAKILLEHIKHQPCQDILDDTNSERSILSLAVMNEMTEIIPTLLELGADPFFIEKDGFTALGLARMYGEEVVKFLVKEEHDDHALFEATKNKDAKLVKYFLKIGYNPEKRDERGQTILHIAVENDDCLTVKTILHHSNIIELKDQDGCTPLHLAVESNLEKMVKIFIENGKMNGEIREIINIKDNAGNTVLHYGIENSSLEIIGMLLDNGADVTLRNEHGYTPDTLVKKCHREEEFDDLTLCEMPSFKTR